MTKPHKEAKRLAKSVKRRRLFAEQLRIKATEVRASSQTLDVAAGEIERTFADRLDAMADFEFATAREEEQKQRDASTARDLADAPRPHDPEAAAKAAKALGILAERGSAARVLHLAESLHMPDPHDHDSSQLLKMVEALLDRELKDEGAAGREGKLFGQRINIAEIRVHGAVRF